MKVIRQVNWSYTLFEDDAGRYVLEVLMPSLSDAWATYERRVELAPKERKMIQRDVSLVEKMVDEVRCNRR